MTKMREGKMLRGIAATRQSNAQLTEADVRAIRRLGYGGASASAIAENYLVGLETIRRILRRDTWKWLSDDETPIEDAPQAVSEETKAEAKTALDRILERNPDLLSKE